MPANAKQRHVRSEAEAFAVENCGPNLIELSLGNPVWQKRGQGRHDRTPDEHRVLAVRRGHDNYPILGACQMCDFLGHALGQALKQGGTPSQNDETVEFLADTNVCLVS